MRIIAQTIGWLLIPALTVLLAVGLYQASVSYQPMVTGHALQGADTACISSPDEFFNDCAVLDTSQVQDLRVSHDSTELEIP